MEPCGILNIYKEAGMTSHDVVSRVRRILNVRRIGHGGTLDPMARGVLPIMAGKATKVSDELMKCDKEYIAQMTFGITTDSCDITGKILETSDKQPGNEEFLTAVAELVGKRMQIPPMHSAVKVEGKKLYELARRGIEIEREPRPIEIYAVEPLTFTREYAAVRIECSKGTYVRSLIDEVGKELSCGAAMSALERTCCGKLHAEDAISLKRLEELAKEGKLERVLIPVHEVLEGRKITVSATQAELIKTGRILMLSLLYGEFSHGERLLVFAPGGEFLMSGFADTEEDCLKREKNYF